MMYRIFPVFLKQMRNAVEVLGGRSHVINAVPLGNILQDYDKKHQL